MSEARASLVLGSVDFIKHIKTRFLGKQVRSRDLPALRQIHEGIDLETVVDLVKGALRETPAQTRNACIYLCRKHTGQTLRTIGQQFGISDAAVSQVCKRFKVRMKSDRTLRKEIAALEEQIKLLKVET